ncbi:P-loop ATPase [Candidatus Woesearchaeota archaeon]|nr:MAG: P-loop ATPase [Candidatus Woesearchaeota archaeon]
MKIITILSGKGGVGKSSITASLALALSKDKKIICADCDVDASNLALVFGAENFEKWDDISTNEKAVFDLDKCGSCKRCFEACYFNAIDWVDNKPMLKDFSCEGCGACELVCKKGAITLEKVNNAKIGYANTKYGFEVTSAQLNPGESGSGKIVAAVKEKAKKLASDSEILLVDSAAGIGCPVIASVTGSDFAVIVTEPTPSGFSDMKKALQIVDHFKIQKGVIINKYDLNEEQTGNIKKFVKEKNIPILGEIPYDKRFTEALTKMIPITKYDETFEELFETIKNNVIELL